MTIHKTKLQKHEYHLRLDQIKKLSIDSMSQHQEIKNGEQKLHDILSQYTRDFNPHRTGYGLKKEEQKVLQRNGVLVEYQKLANQLYQTKDRYHSTLRKITRVRQVDFPDW